MSVVSSSNLMASFSGAFSHAHRMFGSNGRDQDLQTAVIADVVEEVMFNNSSSPTRKSSGGLKRTKTAVSALQLASAMTTAECSHTNQNNDCIVEAKQVEMDFATLTNQPFQLVISAPNGERSRILRFGSYGQTSRFSPCEDGCGHGYWTFEICIMNSDKKLVKKHEERIYLDGVGSLFFTIDENLQIKLSSQEFLRLPSSSQCRSNKNQVTNSINISRK